MHLHGSFFLVTGTGNGLEHRAIGRSVGEVVTENMDEGATMEMAWTPERPGNWLMHCHRLDHVTPALRFWLSDGAPLSPHGAHDPSQAMAGLVLGIQVTGTARRGTTSDLERAITLTMIRRDGHLDGASAYAFALNRGDAEPSPEDIRIPGPPLILTRGQSVAITLRNRLGESTAIHWHGIELESYYDGVPGFSGSTGSTTPAIEDGQSWTARFTPRRAGTFIYHTHSHDNHQLVSADQRLVDYRGPAL